MEKSALCIKRNGFFDSPSASLRMTRFFYLPVKLKSIAIMVKNWTFSENIAQNPVFLGTIYFIIAKFVGKEQHFMCLFYMVT